MSATIGVKLLLGSAHVSLKKQNLSKGVVELARRPEIERRASQEKPETGTIFT